MSPCHMTPLIGMCISRGPLMDVVKTHVQMHISEYTCKVTDHGIIGYTEDVEYAIAKHNLAKSCGERRLSHSRNDWPR